MGEVGDLDLSMRCPNCGGVEYEIPVTTQLQDKALCVECGQIYFVSELADAQAREIELEALRQENERVLQVHRVSVFKRYGKWAFTAAGGTFVRVGALPVGESASEREALAAARTMFPDAAPTAIVRGLDQEVGT